MKRRFILLCLAGSLGAGPRVAAQDSLLGATDSIASPHVRYVSLANLEGFQLPAGEPWSPASLLFLLVKRGALYVCDARDSLYTPRLLLESQVLDARWSPDGTYVACRVRVPTAMRGGAVRFQFVEAMGGPSEYRVPRGRIGPTVWADDGAIYFWDARTGIRKRMQAPLSWRNRRPVLPSTRRTHLLAVAEAKKRRPRVIAFVPSTPPVERTVAALMPPRASHVAILDAFSMPAAPDSGRFLVHLQLPGTGLRTYVVNDAGTRLARLGDAEGLPAFIGTSVSAGGQYVLGHRPHEGAGTLLSSELWLSDVGGTWCTPIDGAGNAVGSRLSRRELFVVHEDPAGDAVRLGRLEIAMP